MKYPKRQTFSDYVFTIKGLCLSDEEVEFKSLVKWLKSIFSSPKTDSDQTSVFDYIDDAWFDYVYSNIEKVATSDYHAGDDTVEHKIAYICVNLNLLHGLPNANKRTSLLALFILLGFNGLHEALNADWEIYYDIAKEIASKGNEKRDDSIIKLRELLKDQQN